MAGEWVPITLFLTAAAIIVALIYFTFKKENSRQETIRAAIDRGQELTEDVVKSLTPPKSKNIGLAFGLPCIGLGFGMLVFGLGIGEPEAAWASAFLLFFGLGFVIYWYIDGKTS